MFFVRAAISELLCRHFLAAFHLETFLNSLQRALLQYVKFKQSKKKLFGGFANEFFSLSVTLKQFFFLFFLKIVLPAHFNRENSSDKGSNSHSWAFNSNFRSIGKQIPTKIKCDRMQQISKRIMMNSVDILINQLFCAHTQ